MELIDFEKALLPKPKRLVFRRTLALPPGDLRIVRRNSPLAANGAADLAAFVEARTGQRPEVLERALPGAPGCPLVLGPRHGSLDALPWSSLGPLPAKEGQSYSIRAAGDALLVAGEGDVGAFNATRTIKQALAFANGELLLPLMDVDDSPDLLERGFWDYFYPAPQRPWSELWHFQSAERWAGLIDDLADHKINLMELQLADSGLNYQSKRFPELVHPKADASANELFKAVLAHGAGRGVKIIPVAVQHPEQMTALLERHPDLAAIAPQGCQDSLKPQILCLSNPKTRAILSGIVEEVAELFSPEGVCVWLPEHLGHCTCPGCRGQWRYLELYMGIFAAAFAKIQAAKPGFRGRMLASYMTYTDKVLKMLPDGVDLVYYECDRHGLYGFDSDKRFPAHLAAAAAQGRRVLGCVSYRGCFTGGYAQEPHVDNIKGWVEVLRDNSCAGVNGSIYSRPGVCRVNLLAMADAAWNVDGRGAADFLDCHVRREGRGHKDALLALSRGWEGWHRLGGAFLDDHGVQRLLDLKPWDYLDANYLTDALEFKDIPTLAGLIAALDAALPLAAGDAELLANLETCRGLLAAKLGLWSALRVYGRMQWPDPQKGPWEDWREEFDRHIAAAVAGLDAAMTASSGLRSRYPFVPGSAPLPVGQLRARLARLLDAPNRARRDNVQWPDIVAFA